jgi:hypothetical protein
MPWMRLSVLLLMVSLIGLANGCGNKSRRASATASETTSATPDGVDWEGQSQANSTQGGRSVTTRNRGGQHPFDQIGSGETYESLVARFGQPVQSSLMYTWSTMSGQFSIGFDVQQNARVLSTSDGASPERVQEIRELVDKNVSFTAMTAHLGSSPTITGGAAVWNGQDGHALHVTFNGGKVMRAEHGAAIPDPLSSTSASY